MDTKTNSINLLKELTHSTVMLKELFLCSLLKHYNMHQSHAWLVAFNLLRCCDLIDLLQVNNNNHIKKCFVLELHRCHEDLANKASTDSLTFSTDLYFDGTAANGSDRFTHKVHIHLSGVLLQLSQDLQQDRQASVSLRWSCKQYLCFSNSLMCYSCGCVTWAMLAWDARRIMMSSFSSLT